MASGFSFHPSSEMMGGLAIKTTIKQLRTMKFISSVADSSKLAVGNISGTGITGTITIASIIMMQCAV